MIGSQLTGGVLSQSVAVFADSAHLGAQVLGIITTLSALRYSDTQKHQQYSYGWQKAHLFGHLISIVSLWVFTAWLTYEATRHLMTDALERP
jgi:cobalt-zinc-cadmium efflux system protein